MAEWSKAAGCKPVSNTHVGSNPTLLKMIIKSQLLNNKSINKTIIVRSWKAYNFNKKLLNPLPFTSHEINTLVKTVNFIENNSIYLTSKQYYTFFNNNSKKPISYLISLNFKRLRFFPGFKTTSGTNFAHLSLGLLSSFFRKGKFFIKSKISYLSLASFFRKLLIFSGIKTFFLQINRNPKYFLEILNTLLEPVISSYKNPFNINATINEQTWNPSFVFHSVIFTNSKPYGKVKVKQKGRLKRKISSRIIKLNRVLD